MPAEWTPHGATWLAWPADASLWKEDLAPAQEEFAALCNAIAEDGRHVLVADEPSERAARAALGAAATFHRVKYGDIWLRDIAPIFVKNAQGEVAAVSFGFNGWGQKYILDHDDEVSAAIAGLSRLRRFAFDWILEGGAVEVDGEGTLLTTRQCLLNPNRNARCDRPAVEQGLCEALGVEKILWLDEGLANDHTDGHVDTLARFVSPGVVLCMSPQPDDPNRAVLEAIAAKLATFTDAKGRRLEVVPIASPGRVENEDGELMPASYTNYYIGNAAVAVPTYGVPRDAEAVDAIAALFPGRRTVGLSAKAILSGGGAFHCITQQQPAERHA